MNRTPPTPLCFDAYAVNRALAQNPLLDEHGRMVLFKNALNEALDRLKKQRSKKR